MRKVIFRVMLVMVVALAAVLITAAQKHITPKAVLQTWFSRSSQSGNTLTDDNIQQGTVSPITTGSSIDLTTSGELSDQDKADVQNFLHSVVQTN